MLEALPTASVGMGLIEIDTPADEHGLGPEESLRSGIRWLHRLGRSEPGDPSLFLRALADWELPAGTGHAYVAAEAGVVRRIRRGVDRAGFRGGSDLGQGVLAKGPPECRARGAGT